MTSVPAMAHITSVGTERGTGEIPASPVMLSNEKIINVAATENPTEAMAYIEKSAYIPVFCCSYVLSDILVAAVNEAIKRVEDTNNSEINKITGQVSVPGIPGLM